MKLKWTVSPAPTGRYRGFDRRLWPYGEYADGSSAALIECEDEYVPANVKTGKHAPLTVRVADWSVRRKNPSGPAFVWRTLKARAATLAEAKDLAQSCIDAHPQFHPKGQP